MSFEVNYCSLHKDIKSLAICSGCGRYLCEACARFSSGRTLCDSCKGVENSATRSYSDRLRYAPKVIKKNDYIRTFLKSGWRILILGGFIYLFLNFNTVVAAATKYIPGINYTSLLAKVSKPESSDKPNPFKKMLGEVTGSLVILQMNTFIGPLELSYQTGGGYPPDFSAFLRNNFESKDKKKDISKDIWDTPYKLDIRPDGFAIISAGIDKQFGTDDDIISPYKRKRNGPMIRD